MGKSQLVKFGKELRAQRAKQGLSQDEFAKKAQLHRTYIGMIERAEKNITLLTMYKLAKALRIDIKEFFI